MSSNRIGHYMFNLHFDGVVVADNPLKIRPMNSAPSMRDTGLLALSCVVTTSPIPTFLYLENQKKRYQTDPLKVVERDGKFYNFPHPCYLLGS